MEVEVPIAGSVLKWDIFTKSADIGFGLYFKPSGSDVEKLSKMKTVMETNRVQCHLTPESGLHTCDAAGTYVMHFDNSFSWTKGKEVTYYMDCSPPVPAEACLSG